MAVERIVSGGQTGIDRAALDAALAAGIACGGWCPRGRRSEGGPIPASYPLDETGGSGYRERTRLNVRDSDGTLIVASGPVDGGTAYTVLCARALGRPLLVVRLDAPEDASASVRRILAWTADARVRTLNVAGPRESGRPGVGDATRRLMDRLCIAIRRSA